MDDSSKLPWGRVTVAAVLLVVVGAVVWALNSREFVWTKTYCTKCGVVKEVKSEDWLDGAYHEGSTTYHDDLGVDFPHKHEWVEPPIDVIGEAYRQGQGAIRDAIVREKVERLGPGSDLPHIQEEIDGFSVDRQREVWAFALDPERPFAWSALKIFRQDVRKETRWQRWEAFTEQYRCEGESEIRCFLEPSGTTLRVVTADEQTYRPIDWSNWTP